MRGHDSFENEGLSLGEIINQQKLDKSHNQKHMNGGRSFRQQKNYYSNSNYSYSNHPYSRFPRNNNYDSCEGNYCYRGCHNCLNYQHNYSCQHNHMCNTNLCGGHFQNAKKMLNSGSNFYYNTGNRGLSNYWNFVTQGGNLKRAQSCESIATNRSFMSGRSMRSNASVRSNWSQGSKRLSFSGHSFHSNNSRRRRYYFWKNKRCPLNKTIHEQIKIVQEKFAKMSEASPLLRLNCDPPNCKPISFATSITMNKRFEEYYNKIDKE
ncbi:probable ATP-dependent RNA helicase ddx42 [Cimex lectularius]|uniref:Uncharacterized protein n=1 Tax=Cimex lectularius TaxID=79782 RepID=A0A8I6S9D4_CIMLE|nr:probable ATP-dependent RNA helicase ddx42 [Cimex lectularius]